MRYRTIDPGTVAFLGMTLAATALLGCSSGASLASVPIARIELLGFEGCPNTPILRDRLTRASDALGTSFVEVDLQAIPASDLRRRYAAPTILVNGRDLFGVPPASTGGIGCRVYPDGPPSTEEITVRLREIGVTP